MKSRFTFLTACICLCTFLFIELPAQTVFQMSFSNGIYMCGKDVILSNGYYYIGGTAKTSTASDFLLIKTDNYGDTIRTLSFHANLPIEGKQILVRNGDVYLLGNCNPGTTLSKGFLAKIRDNGQVLWSRIYGGTGTFEFANALFADDTSIAITGTHTGSGPGGKDILFAQFDTAGIFISSRAYGAANEGGNSITGNREQGFYITGTTDNNDSQGDIFILNLDPNGMQAFCKTYNIVHSSSYSGQHGYSIIRTNTRGARSTGGHPRNTPVTSGERSQCWVQHHRGT